MILNLVQQNNKTLCIPKDIIFKSTAPLYISPYLYIALSYGKLEIDSISYSNFCRMIGRKYDCRIRKDLLPALYQLAEDKYIDIINEVPFFDYKMRSNFFNHKPYALLYMTDIEKILQCGYKQINRLIYILSYLKLNMTKGLFYQSYESIGRQLDLDPRTVKLLCLKLQELNIIGVVPYQRSYKCKDKDGFITIKFQIFSDMHKSDWKERAERLAEKLKTRKNNADENLW